MKKGICFFVMFIIGFSVFAFDHSVHGSWGLIHGREREEFVRFNSSTNEIIIMNTLFRSRDYEEAENTIYISDFDGESVIIQYYLLAPTKLMFILWNPDSVEQSITLILSKLWQNKLMDYK